MSRLNIYWGDIHNHNEIGYGKGSLERSFDLAENTLDFYAFTPHGWWPDLPEDDEKVRIHHQKGFEIVSKNWNRIRKIAEERYREDKFVTFIGWEWHSLEWGDYCIYFSNPEQELHNAGSLDELKTYAVSNKAVMIPHHPGYCNGWRGLNWDCLDESLSPLVEIFSEHGNSLEAKSHLGMYNHSMGGIELSQSGMEQLKRGRKFGFAASSDDHYGYPGGFGYGLTAVYAEKLERESIFNAIKERHTYAVTGDRIKLYFTVNGALPGDLISVRGKADLEFSVQARDKLKSIEIFKNSMPFEIYTGIDFIKGDKTNNPGIPEHLVKVEWGWDFIASDKITKWDLHIRTINSELKNVVPAFCGGAGSVTEMNKLECKDEQNIKVDSFTSRENAYPVNSITFQWCGNPDSGLEMDILCIQEKMEFKKNLKLRKKDLRSKDIYLSMIERFSSPKIKIHALMNTEEYDFTHSITDSDANPGDYYLIKVMQENGQMAWSSPIWIQ